MSPSISSDGVSDKEDGGVPAGRRRAGLGRKGGRGGSEGSGFGRVEGLKKARASMKFRQRVKKVSLHPSLPYNRGGLRLTGLDVDIDLTMVAIDMIKTSLPDRPFKPGRRGKLL